MLFKTFSDKVKYTKRVPIVTDGETSFTNAIDRHSWFILDVGTTWLVMWSIG